MDVNIPPSKGQTVTHIISSDNGRGILQPFAVFCRQSVVWWIRKRACKRVRWAGQSEHVSIWIAVNVNRWKKIRLTGLLGSIVCLGLACCVFGWGLQYKLSLYNPPPPNSHRLPTGKLISGDEQSSTPEGLLATRIKPVAEPAFLVPTIGFLVSFLAVGLLAPAASCQRERDARRARHLGRSILPIFFVRPPPALV